MGEPSFVKMVILPMIVLSIVIFTLIIVMYSGQESETFLGTIVDFDVTISRGLGTSVHCKIFLDNNTIISSSSICYKLVSGHGLYEVERDNFFKPKFFIVKAVSE